MRGSYPGFGSVRGLGWVICMPEDFRAIFGGSYYLDLEDK